MFKRRQPLPILKRAFEILWPKGGWRRSGAYVAHRLRRLPGTPYRIAAGFASGAAISFTPFIGLHFILAAVIAIALRGNLLAAAIGTVVGNPWTFPFIWLWIYSLGTWLIGSDDLTALPQSLSFEYIFENPLKVLLPMTVGGVPTAIFAWFVFFWPIQRTVDQYQKARRRRTRRKLRRLKNADLGRERPGHRGALTGATNYKRQR
ncbi:DUF2062 domain-containing protein [Pelagibius litoralis]|uniref:DUF2062 domain-containing protein n=1 Tax=Pelagibius litoralis TaxID=374515 RepID=A0A967EX00_9PROT|nr:DUF2062 domain-containing protein [Pelagibius litoralis]NIA66995.1 DUF2062 domain-containing protein [Pelagibius litoralis]